MPLSLITAAFATHLRQTVENRNITRTEAARQLRLTAGYFCRLLNGKHDRVSAKTYARLAAWSRWSPAA